MQIRTSFSHTAKLLSIALSFVTVLIIVHKTDALDYLRFISSPKYLYVVLTLLFFACISLACKQKISLNNKIKKLLLMLLSSMLLLFFAINFLETSIHYVFSIIIGFYFIALGLTYIYSYHKKYKYPQNTENVQIINKKYHLFTIILIIFSIFIHLFFGLNHIGNEAYVDERLWIYDRIEQYWDNIIEGDFKNTRPSDKPGITTAIVTGPGLLLFDPTEFEEGNQKKDLLTALFSSFRIPQFFAITILIVTSFFLTRKLLGPSIALFSTLFIAMSPILLGMSRIINPDALLWIILFLCFISFTTYLKENSLKWIYIAGLFLGLALLTKYVANIFIVFFLILIFLDIILHKRSDIATKIKNRIIHYGIMIFVAVSIFFTLYPGAWVKHDRLLLATIHSEAFESTWLYFAIIIGLIVIDTFLFKNYVIEKIIKYLQNHKKWFIIIVAGFFSISALVTLYNAYTDMSLFNFSQIIESPKSAHQNSSLIAIYATAFYPLLFGITPLVLIASLFAIYNLFNPKKWQTLHTITFYSIVFILLYYLASTINEIVPTVRYQIILYPFIILIASIGLYQFIHLFSKKYSVYLWVSIFIIIIGTLQLMNTNGFYFSYNSPLLPEKYIINSKDMGDGNYEIAQYLNALPNAPSLLIWTDKRGVCQFFVGQCNNMIKDPELENIADDIDYYIISQNRENHIKKLSQQLSHRPTYNIRLDRLYDENIPAIFQIYPSDRESHYIKIIEGSTVTIIDK